MANDELSRSDQISVFQPTDLLYTLNEIAAELQQSFQSETDIFRVFTKQVVALGLRGGISLLDESGSNLIFKTIAIPTSLQKILVRFENKLNLSAEGYSIPVESIDTYQSVIRGGRTEFVADTSQITAQLIPQDFRKLVKPLLSTLGTPGGIFSPLVFNGDIKGMLNIVGERLSERDIPAIKAFSNQIAVALEYSQLFSNLLSSNISLKQSEERFQTLSDFTSEGIGLAQDGMIIDGNKQLASIFGYELDDLIGMPISRLIHQDDKKRVRRTIAQGLEEPYEFRGVRQDGRVIEVRVRGKMIELDSVPTRVAVMRDVTEQKLGQDQIRESEERYRNLFETSPQGIIIVDLKGKLIDCNSAFLDLTGYEREDIVNRHFTNLDSIRSQDRMGFVKLFTSIIRGNGDQQVFEAKWLHKDGSTRLAEAHLGVLRTDGRVTGIQAVIKDITESKQHQREIEGIAKASVALRNASSKDEIIQIIFEQFKESLDAQGVSFIYYDPLHNIVHSEAGSGVWSDVEIDHIDADGPTVRVIHTRKAYINNRAKTDPDPTDSTPDYSGRVNAVVCIPMIAQDDVIGAVWLGRETPIDDGSLRLIRSITNIAANAIQRATSFEKTIQSLQRLQGLHDIDLAINASLDVNLTLQVLIGQVINQLKVDASCVLLYDENSQTLKFGAGRGFGSTIQLKSSKILFGQSYAGRAALERKTVKALNLSQFIESHEFRNFITNEDFSSYIGVPLVAKNSVVGVLEVYSRTPLTPDDDWMNFLETLAAQAAITINNARLFDDLQRSHQQINLGYDQTIEGWARTLEMRDEETEGHSRRVTDLTVALAKAIGLEGESLVQIRRGAILHDIGKMAIPDDILQKPAKLNDDEWEIMRRHPVYAFEWLSSINFLEKALDIPLYHHEKWDGSGYPYGLTGKEIPIGARIFAIVDVWDALLSNRPYRAKWSRKETLKYIQNQSGKHFDPAIVKAFLKLVKNQ